MRKPYVPLYASSAVCIVIGLLLLVVDLVESAHLAPKAVSVRSLLHWNIPVEIGLLLTAVGVYHFALGIMVDRECQKESSKKNFLDQEVM
jgi:hypothetical protein